MLQVFIIIVYSVLQKLAEYNYVRNPKGSAYAKIEHRTLPTIPHSSRASFTAYSIATSITLQSHSTLSFSDHSVLTPPLSLHFIIPEILKSPLQVERSVNVSQRAGLSGY